MRISDQSLWQQYGDSRKGRHKDQEDWEPVARNQEKNGESLTNMERKG